MRRQEEERSPPARWIGTSGVLLLRVERDEAPAALPASSAREGSKLLVAGARVVPCLRSRRCSRILRSPLLLRIRRPSAVCGTEKAPRGRICVCVGPAPSKMPVIARLHAASHRSHRKS